MQIMVEKITTLRTFYVHVVSNSAVFPLIVCDVYMLDTFYLPSFFPEYYLCKLCFELPKNE